MDIHIKTVHPQLAANKKIDQIKHAEASITALIHNLSAEGIAVKRIDLEIEGRLTAKVNISAEI